MKGREWERGRRERGRERGGEGERVRERADVNVMYRTIVWSGHPKPSKKFTSKLHTPIHTHTHPYTHNHTHTTIHTIHT